MRAVIVIGHGSLREGSGAAMIRLAARVREAGVAPLVSAAFLNYSRPTFGEALVRVVEAGASEVVVAPYFLVPGHYVRSDLPRLLAHEHQRYPGIPLHVAEPLGDHAALAELVLKRARSESVDDALLLVAHGSPDATANAPIEAVTERVRRTGDYATVELCYLGLNRPLLPDALARLATLGTRHVVVVPYFIQLGGHVARDLPQAIAAARSRYPATAITLAEHLGYDPLLADVLAERVGRGDGALKRG